MTDEQQTAKYISGLRYPIQEHVILRDVFSVDEAQHKFIKIEKLQNRASTFKSVAEKTSNTRTQQSSTVGDWPPVQKAPSASTMNPITTASPTAKGKENPYARSALASVTV